MKATESDSNTIVDVAVGVVTHGDGRVLLAQRPQGKPMPGYWEFPGGKIEPGEAPAAALVRELHEELGIDIESALPWITREYRYPHATARLHMFNILHWQGEPHGREGQALSWQDPHGVDIEPLLPANHAILRALQLPRIYAITQGAKLGREQFMTRLNAALDRGVRLIQVREKDMTPDELRDFADSVVRLAHAHGARVLVNGDAGLADEIGADGVHLQTGQYMSLDSKPDTGLWAASCHNREELLRAAQLEADFAVLSPVLPTQSHPGAPTLGWEHFTELCLDLPMPVYSLGGMKLDMLDTAMAHNAHGIALLSGIW
jgi:8-oxo-dGTP diphosphatase